MSTDAPARRLGNTTDSGADPTAATRAARERETAADIRLYVEIGLAPVTCQHCGIEALVKKNSRKHTSVQWTRAAVARCPEITAVRAADPSALVLGCPRLKASIEDAVAAGELLVPDA